MTSTSGEAKVAARTDTAFSRSDGAEIGPMAATRPRAAVSPVVAVVVLLAAIALGYGLVLRIWLLAQVPLWSDEAIVGIMARAIDDGHFTAFYWGQHYGGLEPYLVAFALKVGGGGAPALNGTPAVLFAVAGFVVGAVAWTIARSRPLALAAAAAMWVWPYVVIWQSVREGGFRAATLCCGLVALLCCIRLYLRRAGSGTFLVLGLALGLGWWASPEIGYFALPCLVLFVAWCSAARWRSRVSDRDQEPARAMAVGLTFVGGLVGSLPWLWANAHTGFATLKSSSFPANGSATFSDRLSAFFHDMLPLQLGVRTVLSGAWVGGPFVGRTLYVLMLVLLVVAVVRAVWLRVRSGGLVPLALAVGVAAYPFLYAAIPGTNYWNDGRYGVYLPPLLVVFAVAVLAPPRMAAARSDAAMERSTDVPRRPREATVRSSTLVVAAIGVVGALCLTVAGARSAGVPSAFFTGWHNGDVPMERVVQAMREHHITDAYGDYWTAYDLDFLSRGNPAISPSPLDVDRSSDLAAQVASARNPAWLFFAPGKEAADAQTFQNPQPGPGPYTEQTFEAYLFQIGIPYKVVKLGILDAVVPQRRVPIP